MTEDLVVSVVSHGHGACVFVLLQDLAQHCARTVQRVVLTLNQPEEVVPGLAQAWPFVLDVRRNAQPLGFAANHNAALADATESFVCVLNPDIRLRQDPFAALLAVAHQTDVGCAYPVQLGDAGQVQDSERALPTPLALWHRRVQGQSERRVDWVNGACLVLPLAVWQRVNGFDERYFMYCEDVDLSLRIRLAGWRIERAPVTVVHSAQRASSRSLAHLAWHVRSLLRLWTSPVYRAARQLPPMSAAPLAVSRS